ncbi:hypothetical protein C8Q72DRAFT_796244 [Fomitopsis betulina]|nr:hypothetical protein C8Q72DRAFT_796244 [Fomitopsis betulina]
MSRINIATSDFINIAAARARDLQAAASLLELHTNGARNGASWLSRHARRQARLEGVSRRAAEGSRGGEQGRNLRPTSKTNEGVGQGVKNRGTRNTRRGRRDEVKENTDIEGGQADTKDGHEPRRSTRLRDKATREAEEAITDGDQREHPWSWFAPLSVDVQCFCFKRGETKDALRATALANPMAAGHRTSATRDHTETETGDGRRCVGTANTEATTHVTTIKTNEIDRK